MSFKVSIITAVLNGIQTFEDCLKSIHSQTYPHIEHIIIDGGSADGTLDIIAKYRDKIGKVISEPDNGVYDAMNKGVRLATGEIIGILNSDDIYADDSAIETVVKVFSENKPDSCYGDLVYVDKYETNKIIRRWKSGDYKKESFKYGWMPPHPTFFVKKEVYERYGIFNPDLPISADYELMLRFLYRYDLSTIHIPKTLVKMRTGGKSKPGFYNTTKAIVENYKAWKINNLNPSPFTLILKPLSKIFQYIKKM